MFAPDEIDEKRDLRNTLLVAGACVVGFGVMILASGPIPGLKVLDIPTLENSLLVLVAGLITGASLVALRTNWPARRVAWGALVAYTLIITLTVHYSGGPLTPMPALYLLVVVAASFLLGQRGATVIAILSALCYAIVLYLEYLGILKMVLIWRLDFDPRERSALLVVNWLAISIPALLTSQLAGALAARLRTTNLHLRQSEQLRESLTSMIVHDLRNPLASLMAGLDILRLTLANELNAEQMNVLEVSRRSGHVLLGMVGELLDIGKMEVGKLALNIQSVDLCKLITESIESVRTLADIEGLDIRFQPGDPIELVPCDKQLISRVMANLLSNAIKYTPRGGQIMVSAQVENDLARISVADTGSGISVQDQQHIFDKFAQVERPGQERRGTGLGLTFCKMAIEAHGGHIWVESPSGQGSIFFFTLPRGNPKLAEGAKQTR